MASTTPLPAFIHRPAAPAATSDPALVGLTWRRNSVGGRWKEVSADGRFAIAAAYDAEGRVLAGCFLYDNAAAQPWSLWFKDAEAAKEFATEHRVYARP